MTLMKLADYDAMILRYCDVMSPTAISFKIAEAGGTMTPEQVAARAAVLLDAPDWLTAAQQDQAVTQKMRQLIVDLQEMTLTARVAEVLGAQLERLGNRLDRRAEATERDLGTLYAFQGSVLLDAINVAMAHMRGAMVALTEITEEQWDNALESAMRFAQLEIAKHEAEGDPDEPVKAIPKRTLSAKEAKEMMALGR